MKNLLLPFLLFISFLVQGQTPDTAAIRVEIDSLIKLNKSLVKEQKLDEALQVIKQAEEKCLAAFGEETALYANVAFNMGRTYHYQGDKPNAESYYLKAKHLQEQAIGKEHPDYASSLNNLANLYNDMGRHYEKAEPLYMEAIAIRERVLGKEHPDYASSLNNLAILYSDMGQYEKAEPLYVEAIAIQERVLSKKHPNYASSLKGMASLYKAMGQYEKAEPLYLEAKAIYEKVFGKEDPNYARGLAELAKFYNDIGNYSKAESFMIEANTIFAKALGTEHIDYAKSLANTALLFWDIGKLPQAVTYISEANTVFAKVLGKDHYYYGLGIESQAILESQLGSYEQAELSFLKAKSNIAISLGKEHPEYIKCIGNMASNYHSMGYYEKAEPLFLEQKAFIEKKYGIEYPNYSLNLDNLGNVYNSLGNYKKAESLYLEAKKIRERVVGKEHPNYAKSLESLANVNVSMYNYEKAEVYYQEAISNLDQSVGEKSRHYYNALNGQGDLYRKMGEYEKAESVLWRVNAIIKNQLGSEHPRFALNLNILGNLYLDMGEFEKTGALMEEAKTIRKKSLGEEHPVYVHSLMGLANLYNYSGKHKKAVPLYVEANEIKKKLLIKASSHLSERELLIFTQTFTKWQNQFLSFAQTQTGLSERTYNNTLFHKGFLLNATQQITRLAQTDSMSNELFIRLKGYNRRLAKAYSNPIKERDSNMITELEEKANTLEKELTRTVVGFGEALRQVNWQEVQVQLQTGEAAIEFVHYQFNNPDPTDSTMYAALVLQSGDEQPRFIPLFEEKQIEQVLSGKDQNENITLAYGSRGLTPKKTKDLQGLYSLIWQPLKEQLKGIEKVYYSPSGLMHRINFAAIPIDPNQSLSDKYQLTRLGSTRSLVIPDLTKPISKNEAVLFGGIEYEMQETFALKGESSEANTTSRSSELSFSYMDRSTPQRGDNWKYLAGTKSEVENIDRLLNQSEFKVTTFSELQATEESFKALGVGKASPRILHLATHGFFFPDPKNESQSTLSGQEPVFKISDHPMIRSGLILAGGNHAWKTGKAMYPDMEDGILTAYEISQMDLSNTELVVLSACETGLGDIEGNEGVYGLQRAFKIAGAKYLIMSLWQVPDHQTQELMTLFYSKWLEGKMAIPEAFRAAQKEMRQKYEDPYFWAGFVLVE